jgi:hypothetical protein
LKYDGININNFSFEELADEFNLFLAIRQKEFVTLKSVINFRNRQVDN